MKKVLTFGVFDCLHEGHINLFKQAKECGDYLIVAVQDDNKVCEYKPGTILLDNVKKRIDAIKSTGLVDEVIVYKDVDKDIQKITFDVFCIGEDQNHDGFKRAIEWCKKNNKEIKRLKRTPNISSSSIRETKKGCMYFIDVLKKNANEIPNNIAFSDETYGDYSFKRIDDEASRIYQYLYEQGFKKGDVIAIRMKRSSHIFVAMLGIMMLGGVFTVISGNSPKEYIEKTLLDTKAIFIFKDSSYEKALKCKRKDDYIKYNLHDLFCIVFSTGSSGIFKGSMHEYGQLLYTLEYVLDLKMVLQNVKEKKTLFATGFYAQSAVLVLIYCISNYFYTFISLKENINEDEIVSLFKKYHLNIFYGAPKTIDYLYENKVELLYAVSSYDVNYKSNYDYLIENCYGLTESFDVITHYVYKKGEVGIIPIGKPYEEIEVRIVDENDKNVSLNQIGEIIFKAPYFRGYASNDELTKKVKKGDWLYTGDLGFYRNDGNIILVGRKIDIKKTGDKYIIPSLIMEAINRCFPNIKKSYVKLFKNKIVLYYVSNETFNVDDINTKINNSIPDYMKITHIVKVDDFIYFPSGKINRLSFKEPN